METVAANTIFLVVIVGQTVHVGVGRQGLVEGGVKHGDMWHGREILHRHLDAIKIHRVVIRGEHRQRLNVLHHIRRDQSRAVILAAAMHDAMANDHHLLRHEGKATAEATDLVENRHKQVGQFKIRPRAFGYLATGIQTHAHIAVAEVIKNTMHVEALVLGSVNAEAHLRVTDIEREDTSRRFRLQFQGVRVGGIGERMRLHLAAGKVDGLGCIRLHSFCQQA